MENGKEKGVNIRKWLTILREFRFANRFFLMKLPNEIYELK